MTSRSTPTEVSRLSRATVTRYAMGSLGTGGFATLPGLVLVYYLTDTLGVAALVAGLIVTGAKIWDVLIDPVIGGLSDRALEHRGSRRGPMLAGAIGLPFAFVLTFAVPSGFAPTASALWVLVAFIAAATFFSLFQVPYIALPAELTDGYRERTRLLTWRVVMLTFAILLFGAGGPEIRGLFPENPALGYLVMAIVAAVLLGLGLWIASGVAPRQAVSLAAHTKTPKPVFSLSHYRESLAVLKQSQPFRALLGTFMYQALATGLMLAGAQFVATWVLRDEGAVTILFASLIAPALLVAPVWQKVADRIGKERGFRIASLIFLAASVILIAMVWAPGWWIVVPVAIAGAAYAGMQTLPMAMLPDVIAHDRRVRDADRAHAVANGATSGSEAGSSGSSTADPHNAAHSGDTARAGVFGGVWTAGETAGMALGSTVLTVVLALTGYVESTARVTVEQPAAAVTGIALSFSLLPASLMLLSLFTLRRYQLREHDLGAGTHTGTHESAASNATEGAPDHTPNSSDQGIEKA